MKHAWFVTGTDTEIGKTFSTCALLHAARNQGFSAVAMKPIAAGVDAKGQNEDVEQLLAASSLAMPRPLVNPYCFRAPVAPHIAAVEEGVAIELDRIQSAYTGLTQAADIVIVEGVGGFCVPLGPSLDSADLAVSLGLPVILVVGLRLGCINHALLTAQAIEARGLCLAGWIANTVDPAMSRREENIEALSQRLPAPLLGIIPRLATEDAETAAQFLRLPF